jgi:DNA polymerase
VNAPFEIDGGWAIATYHPSLALRQQDDNSRDEVLDDMIRALVLAREMADADAPLHGRARNDSA